MPRYYFHNHHRDEEGEELPDDAAAIDAGCQTFGHEIRDLNLKAPGAFRKMTVEEDGGRVVATFSFFATVGG
jgi:hypothetical protein